MYAFLDGCINRGNLLAVFGDYSDLYKGKNASRSYEDAKRRVIKERDILDLDTPKIAIRGF